ncbi:hypothetical protein WDZ92_00355 [Nostoc sp. NIES-2111]
MVGLALALVSGASGQTLQHQALPLSVDTRFPGPGVRITWPVDTARTSVTILRQNLVTGNNVQRFVGFDTAMSAFVDPEGDRSGKFQYYVTRGGRVGKTIPVLEPAPRPTEGRVIVVVQDTLMARLRPELAEMVQDMRLDGWVPTLLPASPTETPIQVKARILAEYQKDTLRTCAVFLIGYVPIPYSGNIWPDGHADHRGAWPADMYYADVRGTWTDSIVNVSGAGSVIASIRNVPRDGKFDNSTTPSNGRLRLGVGRIIFNALPVFSQANPAWTDVELTRRYLQKLHRYKTGGYKATPWMLFYDTFYPSNPNITNAAGDWIDGFSTFGSNGVLFGPFLPQVQGSTRWLSAYMSGPGGWDNCGNVATAAQLAAADSLNVVFTKAYGSYFGDWFLPNNYLRALLASKGGILTASWSGQRSHEYAPMAAGMPLSFVAQRLMGDLGDTNRPAPRSIHNAMLGDVTLHMRYLRPAVGATATALPGRQVRLNWQRTPDLNSGYYVYRASDSAGFFHPITAKPVTALTYIDSTPLAGTNVYQIRAVFLENVPGGIYPIQALGARTNTVWVDRHIVWEGNRSRAWDDTANWQPRRVPGRQDTVTISGAAPNMPLLTRVAELRSIRLQPGTELELAFGADLRLSRHATGPGRVFGEGLLSFVSGNEAHLLACGGDTLTLARLRLADPMGLRLGVPLGITRALQLEAGLFDCNELPVRLLATPTRAARLEEVGYGGNFHRASRLIVEQYLPPPPAGSSGQWHILTPLATGAKASFFEQDNPYLRGTYTPYQSDSSSLYSYAASSQDSLNPFTARGWRKTFWLPTASIPVGQALRVWVKETQQFGAGGPGMLYHRGKPYIGNLRATWQSGNAAVVQHEDPGARQISLVGNPYPCPIFLPNIYLNREGSQGASVYRYDAATQRFAIYAARLGTINGGSPVVPAGEAAFIDLYDAPMSGLVERLKYCADTLPATPRYDRDSIPRIRFFLKDNRIRSEVLMVLAADSLSNAGARQLSLGGPALALERYYGNEMSIIAVDTGLGTFDGDTLFVLTDGLSPQSTRLVWQDEGFLRTYPGVYALYDSVAGTLTRLYPPADSVRVPYLPGLRRPFAIVKYRSTAVGIASRLPSDFHLSPIPTKEYLSIHTASGGRLELSAPDGRSVGTQVLPPGTHRLAIAHLPSGLYLARLNGRVRRWIKE